MTEGVSLYGVYQAHGREINETPMALFSMREEAAEWARQCQMLIDGFLIVPVLVGDIRERDS